MLLGWTLLSVPVTVLVGRVIRRGSDALPGWSADDDDQLQEWTSHRDRLDS